MLQGTLTQQENKWVIALPSLDDFISDTDIFDIHPQHNLWIKIHGKEGMELEFQVKESKAILISKICKK